MVAILNDATGTLVAGMITLKKRYFEVDQHLERHFDCLSSPPPFHCSQIITLFPNSMISTNQEKGFEF